MYDGRICLIIKAKRKDSGLWEEIDKFERQHKFERHTSWFGFFAKQYIIFDETEQELRIRVGERAHKLYEAIQTLKHTIGKLSHDYTNIQIYKYYWWDDGYISNWLYDKEYYHGLIWEDGKWR